MSKTKVVAVSYLNTKPFIYGLEESRLLNSQFELFLEHPAQCAKMLIDGDADIGLVPVAVLPQLMNYEVVGEYCIACNGAVDTVVLLGEVPLHEMNQIYLDYQSKTSVQLIQMLAREYWKISPQWISAFPGYESKIQGNVGGLVIGDRAFELNNKFKYVYDLGLEWKKWTTQPFVFACWVAKKSLPSSLIHDLNAALKLGVENKQQVLERLGNNVITAQYFNEYIHFKLTEEKRKGLNLFLQYLTKPQVIE